jgi:peptide/nickel transport system substrate-binding protein
MSFRSGSTRRRGGFTNTSIVALVVVVFVAAATYAAAAVGSGGRSTALGTLTMRIQQDWPTFDAYVDAGRATSWALDSPAYDRLVSIGRKGAQDPYQPYLATSWVQKAKFVTFKLRNDAKCTDGHTLTAVDILNSVKRFLDVPKRSGAVGSNSIGGFGPGPFHLHANNAKGTFTFASDKPYRNLLGTFANFPIICPAGLAAVKAKPDALETAMYGSGPYTLVSATHGDQVVFKLRPEWKWGPPGTATKNMPSQLVYKVIDNDTTAANLLVTGGLDAALVNGPDIDRLNATPSLDHLRAKNYLTLILVFNMRDGRLFADPDGAKLREAIMTAVDPQKFNQAAYAGQAEVTTSVFRPGSECYDPATKNLVPKPSIDAAKQILTSAGYKYSGGNLLDPSGKPVHIRLNLTTLMNSGPEYIDSVLSALGFDIDFFNGPGAQYGTNFVLGNFDVSIQRGTMVSGDAGAQLFPMIGQPPPAGSNYPAAGYKDAELQRLIQAGYQNPGKGGCKYFTLVQEMLLKKHYLLPLVAPYFDIYVKKGISFPPVSIDGGALPVYYINPK